MFAFMFKRIRNEIIKFSLFVALAISFFIILFIMLPILTQSVNFFDNSLSKEQLRMELFRIHSVDFAHSISSVFR